MTSWRKPGTKIEGVFRIADDPSIVVPLTVVCDGPDRISHFIAAGTRYLRRELLDGTPVPRVVRVDELQALDTHLAPAEWRSNALVVTDPVSAHGVRLQWTPGDWSFRGWYVNLQRPLTRTQSGFTTEDQFLDIVVRPDLTWAWKDEDELQLAIERGRVTADEAVAIRAEGERVVTRIASRQFPFDGSLIEWRPDPAWKIPTLSDLWSAGQ